MKPKKKIVLAYSGGLDTSIILKWLQENYDAEVICYTADVGQEINRKKIITNAKKFGVKNIIIKNLKDMDITERPVHCTDVKREVLYVKDEDKWDKELSEKPKIRKAIKYVAHKNARLLQEFKEKHPDCIKSESKYSDTYNKLMIEAMGGKGCDDDNKDTKIIKRLAKEVIIDSKLDKTIDN